MSLCLDSSLTRGDAPTLVAVCGKLGAAVSRDADASALPATAFLLEALLLGALGGGSVIDTVKAAATMSQTLRWSRSLGPSAYLWG